MSDLKVFNPKWKKKRPTRFRPLGQGSTTSICLETQPLKQDTNDSTYTASVSSPPLLEEEIQGSTEAEKEYQEMLSRIYSIMGPVTNTTVKSIPPPKAIKIGTRKTSFENFMDVCTKLNRPKEHVAHFIKVELNTKVSFSETEKLYIKDNYKSDDLQNIIKKYINEYVGCRSCKCLDTNLKKDRGLTFLVCNQCYSSCAVANLK